MIINLLKVLLFSLFISILPKLVCAGELVNKNLKVPLMDEYFPMITSSGLDSVPRIKQQGDKKQEGKKPDVKQVPKSRKQPKPSAVKGRIKGKPVKINKPKVIKKNMGRGMKFIK